MINNNTWIGRVINKPIASVKKRSRLCDFWFFNAEPGEAITLAAVFVKVLCLSTYKWGMTPPLIFKYMVLACPQSVWTMVGVTILLVHFTAVYYERKWTRICMQILSSAFLLMYTCLALMSVSNSSAGWDSLIFFITSVATIEVLLRKHWKE